MVLLYKIHKSEKTKKIELNFFNETPIKKIAVSTHE